MLDKNRIQEAEINVRSYLQDGLLKKVKATPQIINVHLQNGKESLRVAQECQHNNLSDLWTIVCAYYSMFYFANAALMYLGYKVGDKIVHKVTADALITQVRTKLKDSLIEAYEETKEEALNLAGTKADNLIESFEFERHKRSLIQYKTIDGEKHSKAKTSLSRAKEFTVEMEKILLTK